MPQNLIDTYADWIDASLNPDVYVVATLSQRIGTYASGYKTGISGNADIYSAAYDQFIRRLTIACFGKSHWRRYKRLMPNAATLEGNGNGTALKASKTKKRPIFLSEFQSGDRPVRYHLNMMFRRPDWMTFDEFKTIFLTVWLNTPWAKSDVKIEERTGNCVAYSIKEGPETLLTSSISF